MPADYTFARRIRDATYDAILERPDRCPRDYGLDPQRLATLAAAQAAYETGWGRHYPPLSHNPFGIKPAGDHPAVPGHPHLRQFAGLIDAAHAWLYQILESHYYRDLRVMGAVRQRDTGWPLDGAAWRAWIVAYARIYCPANPEYANTLLQILHQVERRLDQATAREENTKPPNLPPPDEQLDIETAIRAEVDEDEDQLIDLGEIRPLDKPISENIKRLLRSRPNPSGIQWTWQDQFPGDETPAPRQPWWRRTLRRLWPFALLLILGACAHRTLDTPAGYHASETVLLGASTLELTSGTLTIRYGQRPDADDLAPLLEALARGAAQGARP